ncbi:hypothetical protein A6M14_10840 [Acinetobacter sp. Ac_877]|uniref:DUF1398 family protein n=1 Tax=Acinetobacter portensis TaxID=1839785 RepID=UPI00128BC0A2|nr:DUF1398 family protein [Acinetobacter portensis]MPW42086.1 hypothetical protein [Acinetobacter portensis]
MSHFNQQQISIINNVFTKSNTGKIHFGEVIQQLISIDIESYNVNYRRGETTYYLSNGSSLRLEFEAHPEKISKNFDAAKIKSAILQTQSGTVMYPEFKDLTYEAGCIGYIVWINGAKVQYFGCNGDIHTELFPQ